jgi:DNA polymerase
LSDEPNAGLLGDIVELLRRAQRDGQERVALSPVHQRTLLQEEPPLAGADAAAAGATAARKPVMAAPAARPAPVAVADRAARPAAGVAASVPMAASPVGGTPDLSGHDLASLPAVVAACRRCGLHQGRRQTVFADGSPEAALLFVGEGPGEEEDIQGKPFVGRAGQLLTKMIEAMHLQRTDVYICNVVKCRPPQNRTPTEEEARACLPFLHRQIELVRPQVMVLLGATPLLYVLGKKGITNLRGRWDEYRGIPVMPTYHPSYLLRVPSKKREAWADLQAVMERLGL